MGKIFHNKFLRFFFRTIETIFIIFIVCYLSFIVIQRFSGNKSIFGYRLFTVATGSMSGVYEINDVIAVKDYDIEKLKVGDDIAYQGDQATLKGMLITHRLIRIEEGDNGEKIYVTKGVNAPAEDFPIKGNQILGKVIGIVPVISPLNHILKSQAGFFLLIFCPIVLVIVLEVLQTITDIRLERHEIQEIQRKRKEEKTS